jgi:hypothetical protein
MNDLVVGTATTLTSMDWSTIDLNSVFNEVLAVVPYAMGTVLAFLGFKKGLAFLKKQIKGA